jgi:hypothetical protein
MLATDRSLTGAATTHVEGGTPITSLNAHHWRFRVGAKDSPLNHVHDRDRNQKINTPNLGRMYFVWTGRAVQAGCDDLEIIGLAHLYSAH